MINSIYTHKEIFLRELISNASDAMDKLCYKSMTENLGLSRGDFEIFITADKDNRIVTITDNGIGMNRDELEQNLGVIAKSGSLNFKKALDKENESVDNMEDMSIIGQFGVGFYSAFMVAEKVAVKTKAYGSNEALMWTSEGADGYTIEPCEKDGHGTEITLFIKENTDDEQYNEFLEQYRIKNLIVKYSDYIRYPIKMEMKSSKLKDNADELDEDDGKYEDVTETQILNSMIPIWKKTKSELKDDDYNEFYKSKFFEYNNTDPIAVIHDKTEGTATYTALMFIPQKAPFDFYTKEYEKGLQLYSSGVMIMEKCSDLLPDYFSFVKGLVDSEDLSLNISREMLQHDRQLKVMARSIERSVRNELRKLFNNDRDKYAEFWKTFGTQIKYGVYNNFGQNAESLQDLLMFHSSNEVDTDKYTTLREYIDRMAEKNPEQDAIYYATGDSLKQIDSLPLVEGLKDKGVEVLYLIENVDEFCMQSLGTYNEKPFKSIQSADVDIASDDEKEETQKANDEFKSVLESMRTALDDRVTDVRIAAKGRLKSHAVCLTSSGFLTNNMEKILRQMPDNNKMAKAERILELNSEHPILDKLQFLCDNDKDKLAVYADILYNQACLIEGIPIDNPAEFAQKMCGLLV
jgi:molecular chaperone HtpG